MISDMFIEGVERMGSRVGARVVGRCKGEVVRCEESELKRSQYSTTEIEGSGGTYFVSIERFLSLRRSVEDPGETVERERSWVVVLLASLSVESLVEDFIDLRIRVQSEANEQGRSEGCSDGLTVYLEKSTMPCWGSVSCWTAESRIETNPDDESWNRSGLAGAAKAMGSATRAITE